MTVIDLFAGCGGWDVGARDLGIDPIGIEMDADACATRALHGMPTIRADLTTLDPLRFAGIDGLIASPPCQDWSMAGSRKGITGETGRLVMEVLRWATAIGPRWVACEQVPPALPVWEFFAHHLRDFGYKTWTGVLEAERYGVPQTRERAFLLAHRDHQPEPPVPTHQRYVSGEPARYEPASMFHAEILPWVSAAEACGWGRCDGTMEHQRGAGMAERHGDRDPRPIHAPAPTMTAGAGRRIKVDRWIDTRRDQRPDGNAIRLNIAEGLVLQSFPHDFALAGNKTSQWRQVGNAVPPLLSKVTLAALLRLESEAVATFACTWVRFRGGLWRVVLTPEQWATYHRETL